MIVCKLIRSKGHGFEEWFDNVPDSGARAESTAAECPASADMRCLAQHV